jgi:hypothetical protein
MQCNRERETWIHLLSESTSDRNETAKAESLEKRDASQINVQRCRIILTFPFEGKSAMFQIPGSFEAVVVWLRISVHSFIILCECIMYLNSDRLY